MVDADAASCRDTGQHSMTTSINIIPDNTVIQVSDDKPVIQIAPEQPVAVIVDFDDSPSVTIEVEETSQVIAPPNPTVSINAEHDVEVSISDVATIIGSTNPGGSGFLPRPDRKDDVTDPANFYFGWASIEGTWAIQRQSRAGGPVAWARFSNNSSAPNLDAAWPDRETLNYA